MAEPLISSSGTAPALGFVLGLVLYFVGFPGLGLIIMIGSGLLLVIRLFGLGIRLLGWIARVGKGK